MILVACFHAVVSVAEALPIALIPEQRVIASVRLDVVYIGRLDITSFFQALHTQGVCFKVTLTRLIPCSAIAAASCGACILRMK